jgi:hypothetical protein
MIDYEEVDWGEEMRRVADTMEAASDAGWALHRALMRFAGPRPRECVRRGRGAKTMRQRKRFSIEYMVKRK